MQADFSDFFSHIFPNCGKTKAPALQRLHLEIINSLIRRFTIRNLVLLHFSFNLSGIHFFTQCLYTAIFQVLIETAKAIDNAFRR